MTCEGTIWKKKIDKLKKKSRRKEGEEINRSKIIRTQNWKMCNSIEKYDEMENFPKILIFKVQYKI